MKEGTNNPLEVADMKLVGEGGHGMDDEKGEVMDQELVLVREREQAQGDAGGELVGVVVGGNVQAGAGNDRIHRVDSSRVEGDHSFHIDSGEVADHMWRADRVVGCDSGVKEVEAAEVQCVHTNNYHDDHIECDRRVAGSGKSG
jgi:hypothetical protein